MGAATVTAIALAVIALAELAGLIIVAVLLRRSRAELARLRQSEAGRRPRSATGRAVAAVVGTAMRVRDEGVGGLLLSSLDELTKWTSEDRAQIVKVAAPDGTVTIVFSDIEGSTALNEELGDARWMRVLESHDRVVRTQVERHGGHVVKSQGDGFMVVFGDPAEALHAAVGTQRALRRSPGRPGRQVDLRVRIGVHVGAVVSRDGDYFGRNVAFAARVAAQAKGGEILVSDQVRVALGDGQSDFALTPRDAVELKGIADRHTLWQVEVRR